MPFFSRMRGVMSRAPDLPDKLTGGGVLWWVFRHQAGRVVGSMVAGTVWMSTLALTPVVLGFAINRGVAAEDWSSLSLWLAALLALGAANAALWVTRHNMTVANGRRSMGWVEQQVARRVLNERGGLDARASGEVVSLVGSDARYIARFVETLARGAGAVLTFAGVITAMFFVNAALAAVLLGVLLPLLAAVLLIVRRLEKQTHHQQTALASAAAVAGDAITGLRVIRGVAGDDEMAARYRQQSSVVLERGLDTTRTQAVSAAMGVAMPASVVLLVGWYGGRLATSGALSVGELVTFSGWAVFLMTPLRTMDEIARRFAIAHAAAGRIGAILATPASVAAPPSSDAIDLRDDVPQLDIRDLVAGEVVNVSFPAGAQSVLQADHLAASALTAVLSRFVEPDGGTVLVGRHDLQSLPLDSLRSVLLVAEHDAMLFHGSLRRNLLVAKPDATDAEMLHALHLAAATDIVASLTDGLDGIVSERGRSLSGGQRQRVALARALLVDPPVLVLVDPTSAVDAYTESEIVDRVSQARTGMTTIVITSSGAFARRADHVFSVIDDEEVAS
jgi:ABC-type multidrug transport system fused ATPase/permease subunit